MDAIRCDEKDFLIWKWRPDSSREAGQSKKENSIRYGSSLRVRPGQAFQRMGMPRQILLALRSGDKQGLQ